MTTTREELIAERDRIQAQIDHLEDRLKAVGAEFVAVTDFHDLMCHGDHIMRCGWFYESDDAFDQPQSTHGQWVERYRKAKIKVEEATGDLTNESFIAVVRGVNLH